MTASITPSQRALRGGAIAALVALAGCASTQLDAEWRDPQLSAGSLRGARVLVACDAFEVVVVQLCRDQIASAVGAQGATPVFVPTNFPISPARAIDPQLLLAARDAGAKAMTGGDRRGRLEQCQPGHVDRHRRLRLRLERRRRHRRVRAGRRRQPELGLHRQRPPHGCRERTAALDREGDVRRPRATSTRRWASSRRRSFDGGNQGRRVLSPAGLDRESRRSGRDRARATGVDDEAGRGRDGALRIESAARPPAAPRAAASHRARSCM